MGFSVASLLNTEKILQNKEAWKLMNLTDTNWQLIFEWLEGVPIERSVFFRK